MQQIISSAEAPGAIGPYSQAIKHGDFVFLSGQLPIHAADGTIPGAITGQARRALVNTQHVLAAAGCTVDDVAKTTCYLSAMSLFQPMNEVYASVFQNV